MAEHEDGEKAHECATCGVIYPPWASPASSRAHAQELRVMEGVDCWYPVMEPDAVADQAAIRGPLP